MQKRYKAQKKKEKEKKPDPPCSAGIFSSLKTFLGISWLFPALFWDSSSCFFPPLVSPRLVFPPLGFFPPVSLAEAQRKLSPVSVPASFYQPGREESPNLPAADGATTRAAASCPLRLCPFLRFTAAFYFFDAFMRLRREKKREKKRERRC